MKKVTRVLAVGLSAAMVLGAAPVTASAASDAHLNFGCYVYSTSFDPANYQNSAWMATRLGIGEGLFHINDDLTAEPMLCDTYEVSDDKMTWTFHIRDGVQFSNGHDCDAQAVADSLNRLYTVIEGEDYNSTPRTYIDVDTITADTDANTVTIVTKKGYSDLPQRLSFSFFIIIDVDGDITDENHPGGYGTDIIATGPYAVSSFDELSKSGELVANEYYWNGEVPYGSITFTHIEDDSTKAMSIQSGDIDLTENITTASDLETLKSDDSYYVSTTAGMRTGFAYINFAGVLGNDSLRQAVQMAIDGQTLCDVTVGGIYTYGFGVLPSTIFDATNLTNPYAYDVEAAKALLDEAGIVDSDGNGIRELDGTDITLNYITYKNRCLSDFAEAIQMQLAEIGISVNVQSMDSDTEWNMMQAGEYDLADSNWITTATGDPTATFLVNWYGGEDGSNIRSESNTEGANYCNYENDEFDALYDAYGESLDEEEKSSMVEQMQQILVDDAAVLVHGYYNSTMISNASKVTGAEMPAFDYYWLSTSIKPAE